jgi:dTDP-4-dehydrorhamnose reductase
MLYLSTDYVFDGTKSAAYLEDDCPNPISVYGKSKWLGEQHVRAILKRYFIARTSWLYGPNRKNFVSAILRVAHPAEGPPSGERPAWLADLHPALIVKDCGIG